MQTQFHNLMDNVETRFEDKLQSQFLSSSSKRARIHSPQTGTHTTMDSDTHYEYQDISQNLFDNPPDSPQASTSQSPADPGDIAMRK